MREVGVELLGRRQPDTGALLLARLGQDELVPSDEPEPEHRRLRALRACGQEAEAPRAHQVDAQHELVVLGGEEQVLAAPASAREPAAFEDVEWRVEGLERRDVRGPGTLDRVRGDLRIELAHPGLDLG